jgi:hypothetical protein
VPVPIFVPAKSVKDMDQVIGILPGGIESNVEPARCMAASDPFESIAKLCITLGGLGEREFVGSRLEVIAQEGDIVAVTRGVDADAEARGKRGRLRDGSGLKYHEILGERKTCAGTGT